MRQEKKPAEANRCSREMGVIKPRFLVRPSARFLARVWGMIAQLLGGLEDLEARFPAHVGLSV